MHFSGKWGLLNHPVVIESLRFKKSSKILESSHKPDTAKSTKGVGKPGSSFWFVIQHTWLLKTTVKL